MPFPRPGYPDRGVWMNRSAKRHEVVHRPVHPIVEPVSEPAKCQVRGSPGVVLSVRIQDRAHHRVLRSQHSRGRRRVAPPTRTIVPAGPLTTSATARAVPRRRASASTGRRHPSRAAGHGLTAAPPPAPATLPRRPVTARTTRPRDRCRRPRAAPAYGAAREARPAPPRTRRAQPPPRRARTATGPGAGAAARGRSGDELGDDVEQHAGPGAPVTSPAGGPGSPGGMGGVVAGRSRGPLGP